jgi:hypothetical protein
MNKHEAIARGIKYGQAIEGDDAWKAQKAFTHALTLLDARVNGEPASRDDVRGSLDALYHAVVNRKIQSVTWVEPGWSSVKSVTWVDWIEPAVLNWFDGLNIVGRPVTL